MTSNPHTMNSHQLCSLFFYLASILVVTVSVPIREDKKGVEASSLPGFYMGMKDIFQVADEVSEADTTSYKIKAYQNMFYRPPSQPSSINSGRPQHDEPYFQQERPIQPQQQHRPQYLPEQNSLGDDDLNKTENSEKEGEKVDMIDEHFDYSDIDTIEGGINDGQDFEEFMEMVE